MEVLDDIITSKKLILLIIPFLFFIQSNASTLSIFNIHASCQNETLDLNFLDNDDSTSELLSKLSVQSSSKSFYAAQVGVAGQNASYGFYYCNANVNAQDCQTCVETSVNASSLYCLFYKGAFLYSNDCTLWYANYTVSATTLDESITAWLYFDKPFSYNRFNDTVYSALDGLITEAANGSDSKGYAKGEMSLIGRKEKLFTLAQCTPDILGNVCNECLRLALQKMPEACCNGTTSWNPNVTKIVTFLPHCQVRYEVGSSLSSPTPFIFTPGGSGVSKVAGMSWYVMLVLAVAAFALH